MNRNGIELKNKQFTEEVKKIVSVANNLKRINEIAEEIEKDTSLSHLFKDDVEEEYNFHPKYSSKGFDTLQKCIIETKSHPFLNEFIDLSLQIDPSIINHQNEKGQTPLMIAALSVDYFSTEETFKILLKYNPKLDVQDNDGKTVIMHLCDFGTPQTEIILLELFKLNPNIYLTDNERKCVLMHACERPLSIRTINPIMMILEKFDQNDINMTIYDKRLISYIYEATKSFKLIQYLVSRGAKKYHLVDPQLVSIYNKL